MGIESEHHKSSKSSWKKRLAVIFAVLVILAGIACIFDALAMNELGRAMNAARAMGGPVTMQELMAARKQWPDGRNGANVILSIKNALEAVRKDEKAEKLPVWGDSKATPELGRRWLDAVDRNVHEFLTTMQKELAAIDSLKQYEGGQFPMIVGPDPFSTLLPNLSPVRATCKLKHLQALDRAMHNDTTHLVDDVTVMLKMADLVDDDPFLISSLVRIACASLTLRTIEEVCGLAGVDPTALRQLQDRVARLDEGNRRIAVSMRGERAIFIGGLDYARTTGGISTMFAAGGGGATSPSSDLLARLPGARGVLMRDEATGILLYNRLVAAAEKSRALPEARAIELEIPKLSPLAMMTRALFPSFTRAMILDTRLNAEARCAQVALAAERFRIEIGRFPTRLDEVVPKYLDRVPADPFKPAEPLRVYADATRFLVYSVGEDELDNGGDVRRDSKTNNHGADCGFILLAPAARNQPPLPAATRPEEGVRSAASAPASGVSQ